MADNFSIVKKGYDPAEVDKYIESLEMIIKNYKEKDAAINNALISAQIAASEIINNANKTAGQMTDGAVAKLDAVTKSIATQRRLAKEFQDDYNRVLGRYLREVNENEILELFTKINDLEDYISSLSATSDKAEEEKA